MVNLRTNVVNVELKLRTEPRNLAEVLNTMAAYLEGNEPPPDHWDERKREEHYRAIAFLLTPEAIAMVHKLQVQYELRWPKL